MNPSTDASSFKARTASSNASCVMSAGCSTRVLSKPTLAHAFTLWPTYARLAGLSPTKMAARCGRFSPDAIRASTAWVNSASMANEVALPSKI